MDLERLSEGLVNVVDETMQPAHVSPWLREPERELRLRFTLHVLDTSCKILHDRPKSTLAKGMWNLTTVGDTLSGHSLQPG